MQPETFRSTPDVEPLLERIGDARVVLLGEMTHGTSEFYDLRTDITLALVRRGFDIVALEADWPDAARVDHYVRARDVPSAEWQAFARWPPWMWRNEQFARFCDKLHGWNAGRPSGERAMMCGLDLYSMGTSMSEVLAYLERQDEDAALLARRRYGCLSGWQEDPVRYGSAAERGLVDCEEPVVAMLQDMLARRLESSRLDGAALFDAQQNARVVAAAQSYYRSMYRGEVSSWNLRDTHMMEALKATMAHRGRDARAVVWAHNSHVGDARGSEMASHGETTLGTLCRQHFGNHAYLLGQFTDRGTVMAADRWDGKGRVMDVAPSRHGSHGAWLRELGDRFLLPMTDEQVALERAIGVVYRPGTERISHHFTSDLARRFDEVLWCAQTQAVTPLETRIEGQVPETYPFGV